MKPGAHIVLRAAARFYTPLVVLFALSLLASRPAGGGIGFISGVGAGLALALHMLVYGAATAGAAFPAPWARALLALGLLAVLIGAGAPSLPYAPHAVEMGLFVLMFSGTALILTVLVGRAPTLRDEDW